MRSRLTIFTLVTAWANLLHQLSYSGWIRNVEPLGWALFLTSIACAIRPSSFRLLVALVVLRVVHVAWWTPMVRGHIALEGLFMFGVATGLALGVHRLGHVDPFTPEEDEDLFESFAPVLRATTLIVYGAVVLAKLNVDFFDTDKSAAVKLLLWTGTKHPGVPTDLWARQVAIWSTIAFEAGIPVLLWFRKTRWLGLAVGVLFHAVLGLLPLKVASFSLTMCLLLVSWLPRGAPAAINAGVEQLSRLTKQPPRRIVWIATMGAMLVGIWYARRAGGFRLKLIHFGLGLWFCETAVMLAALWTIRACPTRPARTLLRQRFPVLWILVGLMVVNCLCPYIGLKTRTTLTMHSSLRTEAETWNHLFVPQSIQVFGYQDDLVVVLASDLADFAHLAKKDMPLPYFEFRRWCRLAKSDFFVEYQRRGETPRRFEKRGGQGSDPALMEAHPVAEWFLCFNPVGASHDYMPSLVPRLGPARNVVPD